MLTIISLYFHCNRAADSTIYFPVLVNGSNGVNKHDKENGSGKSNSPPHVNGKEGKKRRHSESFEPVLDEKLKTTTQVPGAYAPLDKEKCNGFKV